jgi:hypothetical protein
MFSCIWSGAVFPVWMLRKGHNMKDIARLGCVCLLILIGSAVYVQADDAYWRHDPASQGDWFVPGNWSTGLLPGPADTAYIDNDGTALVGSGAIGISELLLGDSSTGGLIQSGGDVVVGSVAVAEGSQYELTGGTLQINNDFDLDGTLDFGGGNAAVTIADNAEINWSQGTLLNAGNASVSAGAGSVIYIHSSMAPSAFFGSFNSDGEVYQVSGTTLVVPVDFVMDITSDRPDRIRVEGVLRPQGSPSSPQSLTLSKGGVEVAPGGEFNMHDAGLTVNADSGVYGGNLEDVSNLYIAMASESRTTFTQTDGSTSVNNTLQVGGGNESQGSFELEGGTVTLGGSLVLGYSNHSQGTFIQSGGALSISRNLRVGYGYSPDVDAEFVLSDGTVTVGDNLTVGLYGDCVLRQSGGSITADEAQVYAGDLYELTGGSLTIRDRFDLHGGVLDFDGGDATVTMGDNAIGEFSTGTLLNAAGATYTAGVNSESYFAAGFNPYVEFGSFSSQGLVHTQGTTLVVPVSFSGHVFRLNANSLEIAGTIILDAGGQITTSSFDLAGGTLMGEGTVVADTFLNDGIVSSGLSPGRLDIHAPYVQGSDGCFLVELGGLIPEDEHDVIVIDDVASLGGTLEVFIIDGFAPSLGDHFDIMQAESFVGGFDTMIFPDHYDFALSVVNLDTTLRLTAIVVPDPATMGDTNEDGVIDELDFGNLVAQFGGDPDDESADFNGDGRVDLNDFVIMRENFGFGVGLAPDAEFLAATPEPATLSLLALGGLVVLRRRKRGARR